MSVGVLIEDHLEIPAHVHDLPSFRAWARSEQFPERARIDFINGMIEVDTVTEDVFTHGSPKAEISRVQMNRVKGLQLGHAFLDCTRVSCPSVDLSVEPDIVIITFASIGAGRVRLVRSKSRKKRRYVEIEGSPDLITEVLSDTSEEKDTQRLFRQYFAAGVEEYWLVDAREDELEFRIYRRGRTGFVRAQRDRNGFQTSKVLGAKYLLERVDGPFDSWVYTLHEQE